MKTYKGILCLVAFGIMLPLLSNAQVNGEDIEKMQTVLENLHNEMMPSCQDLIGVGQGIAGFGALWFIAYRVWKHIANAEPVDFYPLFRPFVLGFCILNFIFVLKLIDGIFKPTVEATAKMVKNSDKAIKELLKQKADAIKSSDAWKMYIGFDNEGDRDLWYKYTYKKTDPNHLHESFWGSLDNGVRFELSKMEYRFKNQVKEWMAEVLHILYAAAALCINTLRTFQLIVLDILGPLVFGIAVFDGFQHTLSAWLAKYINVYLWLPVANIFGAVIGKIQENLIKIDLSQIHQTGDTFFSGSDTGYLCFLIIGIIGYFTVPSVASFVINAGGGGAMSQKITTLVMSTGSMAGSGAMKTAGAAQTAADNMTNAKQHYKEGLSGKEHGAGISGAVGHLAGKKFLGDKLAGKKKDDKKTDTDKTSE